MNRIKRYFSIFFVFLSFAICCAKEFTIAVIPDTQSYVDYRLLKSDYSFHEIYYRQMQYIVDNSLKKGGTISYAIHLGDVVNNYSYQLMEWIVSDAGFSLLDDIIPFMVIPGNHDYDESENLKESPKQRIRDCKYFTTFFGPESKHFKDKEWYGGSYNGGMNSWQILSIGDEDFLILGLEVEPSQDVLDWAQTILSLHKNPTIVCTHEFLSTEYDKNAPGNAAFSFGGYRLLDGGLNPKDIMDSFIKKHNQIFLVLCGHYAVGNDSENARTDLNENGNKVYSLLSDYQFRNSLLNDKDKQKYKYYGGDGWLRLLTFDKERKSIHIQTYSTELKCYEKDFNSDFVIQFDWDWNERFDRL